MSSIMLLIMGLLIVIFFVSVCYFAKKKRIFNIVMISIGVIILLFVFYEKYDTYSLLDSFKADKVEIISIASKDIIEVDGKALMKNVKNVVIVPEKPKGYGSVIRYDMIFYKKNRKIITLKLGVITYEEFKNDDKYINLNKNNVIIQKGKKKLEFSEIFYKNLEKIINDSNYINNF
ncbi:hypothetical protein CLTEP_26120 [Clostridium tepidiprofundi DSM 19306]|uniref:Uncharacterized protein n=1 Tax=Clostridium tepidiprofundi DSM 19306 TaxID=1121338 RepID=A0A151ASB7_9CLOT|nr:hypothetical protein [Clostridium tepidiprofundi]KYH30505.1 hypothetical protein CLTEP_26120 [Clostridium tepidiprofundi DSM 19306]